MISLLQNVRKILMKRIAFEFCPTSNLQTTSLPNYEAVPWKLFRQYGIMVTINSDNMTVSNTDVLAEYRHLFKTYQFQKFEVRHLLENAIEASFASFDKKIALRKELDKRIDRFYESVSL